MDVRVALPFMSAYAATAAHWRACRKRRGAFFLRACALQHRVGVRLFRHMAQNGVDLCGPEVVAREILATIRQRRRAHIMGGSLRSPVHFVQYEDHPLLDVAQS
jgi:hypothetical protein